LIFFFFTFVCFSNQLPCWGFFSPTMTSFTPSATLLAAVKANISTTATYLFYNVPAGSSASVPGLVGVSGQVSFYLLYPKAALQVGLKPAGVAAGANASITANPTANAVTANAMNGALGAEMGMTNQTTAIITLAGTQSAPTVTYTAGVSTTAVIVWPGCTVYSTTVPSTTPWLYIGLGLGAAIVLFILAWWFFFAKKMTQSKKGTRHGRSAEEDDD
jgi:hypothetical protein